MKLTKSQLVTIDITAEEMATVWWEQCTGEDQARFFNKLYDLGRESFEGTLLPPETKWQYPNGNHGNAWSKHQFKPLIGSLTIKISN